MKGRCLVFALALAAALPAAADSQLADVPGLRGDFSGTWYDPAKPGQGVMVEIRDRGQATVAWFTFDAAGAPMWLFGVADVRGTTLSAQVSRVSGGAFPPAFDPTRVQSTPWGTLELDFAGCGEGTLKWMPTAAGFNPGQMPLARLTSVHGTRCQADEEFDETRHFSLERGNQDFEAVFADKPPGQNDFFELDYVYEALPPPLEARRGMRICGNNHSDDLAMLIKREIKGLAPNATYRIAISAEIASNVPSGCFGTGGSPGDSVYMRLGASTQEPLAITATDGWLRLNIGYGQQAQDGADARVVDTLGNSYECGASSTAPWELRTLDTGNEEMRVRTDADGAFWLMVGSDSGFESRTDWYLTAATVYLARTTDVGPLR